jgi:hypothetical protein
MLVGPDSLVIDRLSNITVQVNTVLDAQTAPPVWRSKSATIVLTGRYFNSRSPSEWLYCPLGTCPMNATFKDETLTVDANFINNVLHIGDPANGDTHILNTLFGNLYFLQPQLPTY